MVTDNRGYTCLRKDIDQSSGCCLNFTKNDEALDTRARYSCADCDLKYQCCKVFEYCVSCCLGTFNEPEESTKLMKAMQQKGGIFRAVEDLFDLCLVKCRTSSKSVVHENSYRSDLKYCFGEKDPPLIARQIVLATPG